MVSQTQGLFVEMLEATQNSLDLVPCKLTEEQKRLCDLALSLDELSIVLHEMADGKAPGLDGFPCKFYKATWEFVGPDQLH